MQLTYPSKLQTGLFCTMGMRSPPMDNLELVLRTDDQETRLWGRLRWDGMNIIFVTDNIMRHDASNPRFQLLKFVWRARSPDNGIALVNDEKLTGDLRFNTGPDSDGIPERYTIHLGGVGFAMDMYIYGEQVATHDSEAEAKLQSEVKQEWEALRTDSQQADLNIVLENHVRIDERALKD